MNEIIGQEIADVSPVGFRVPDFFVVGAPKAGTSSLYHYLAQHPDIFVSDPKEPHFFYNRSSPGSPVLGEKDLGGYLGLFEGAPRGTVAGEASTSYLWLANAAREIKEIQPQAKIIAVLRDPAHRAYSHYLHQLRDGRGTKSFEEALGEETGRIRRGEWHGLYYADVGMYAGQLERYLGTFGRESVRVYLFEDLARDAGGVARDAFSFLGVDPSFPVQTGRVYNKGGAPRSRLFARLLRSPVKWHVRKALPLAFRTKIIERLKEANNRPVPEMRPETEAWLRNFFREDVGRLEEKIGRDLSHWKA